MEKLSQGRSVTMAEATSKTRRGKQFQNTRTVRAFPKFNLTVPLGTRQHTMLKTDSGFKGGWGRPSSHQNGTDWWRDHYGRRADSQTTKAANVWNSVSTPNRELTLIRIIRIQCRYLQNIGLSDSKGGLSRTKEGATNPWTALFLKWCILLLLRVIC